MVSSDIGYNIKLWSKTKNNNNNAPQTGSDGSKEFYLYIIFNPHEVKKTQLEDFSNKKYIYGFYFYIFIIN